MLYTSETIWAPYMCLRIFQMYVSPLKLNGVNQLSHLHC